MTAEKASNELTEYMDLLMESPSDPVIDTGTLLAKAIELFLKMEQDSGSFTDILFKIAYDYDSSVSERMEQIKELLVKVR